MNSIPEFLSYLRSLDIHLWAEEERLRYNAPKGALTQELREQLRERKTEILAFLRQASVFTHTSVQPIEPIPRDQPLPLSFNQQRLWFLNELEGPNPIYNVPMAWRILGPLNIDVLETCITEIVRRHEALRTTFADSNGTPVQKIAPPWDVYLPVVDLQHLSEDEVETEARKLAFEDIETPFDLTQGPLFRGTVFRLKSNEHVLVMVVHHIIFDVWSIGVFIKELSALYSVFSANQPSPLPDLPIQYADFAHWQNTWLSGEILEQQLTYWKEKLAGPLPILELPADSPRPPVYRFRGAVHTFMIPDPIVASVRAMSQKEGVTLFMVLLTVFKILLYRYTEQEDIIVGSPIANRTRPEVAPLIGFFVNTMVLRTDLSGNPNFLELLSRVKQTAMAAYAHQDTPFQYLVESLHIERNLSHPLVFQTSFILQNSQQANLDISGLKITQFKGERNTAGVAFDLNLTIEETESGLMGIMEYNQNLFDDSTIARMSGHFQNLLQSAVSNPHKHITELSLLTESEYHQILVEWNETQAEYPADACIHQLFEKQTERTPHAIAVIFEDQQLTYQELNSRANQLAHYLQKFGVGPEVLVGLCVDRSLEMIIGILGVLKAGGAYLPLDSAYPQERLAFMISDARILVLLTQEHLRAQLPEHHAQVIMLDTDWSVIDQEPINNPRSPVLPDNLAYVIYTSGSTGRPKGTLLAHRGLCNVAQAHAHYFQLTPHDNVLQFASFSFDSAIAEIVMALTAGATIVLGERETLLPGPALIKFLQDHNISMLTFPPSVLANLPAEKLPALRQITVAGEACPPDIASRWAQGRLFLNLYGPTETTIWATVAQCTEAMQKLPIGRPIDNTQVYILGEHFEPMPIGVPGELYIGGVGLARGYLHRPGLTAEKFIPNPFSQNPGARLYKTGDLVRYLPDGNIEFLGRIDHQVKLRGFRIELGEIEATLSNHPLVRETAVIIREDRPDQKRLVAYIVPENEQSLFANDLRQFLSKKLPDYMVPTAYVMLDALPLTPNGKIDRRALPMPETLADTLEDTHVAPRTPLETLLAEIWAESLQVKRIGIHDDFFELGGHSLQATQVISKISVALDRDIPVKYLFLYPIVAALAEKLEQEIQSQTPASSVELSISSDSPRDTFQKTPSAAWDAQYSSPSFQIERRSLTALLTAGKIAPVEAAALSYLPSSLLQQSGLSRNEFFQTFFEDLPLLTSIIETQWGRIGILALPRLSSELYTDPDDCVRIILDALQLAKNIGAQVVSLTGIIPSATDYGYAITRAIDYQEDLPRITTGHATTTAAVVLAIKAVLEQGGRDLTQERVGFIGLGSVGMSSLSLILQSLPHPQEIILCDVYSKRDHLEKVQDSIVKQGFQGKNEHYHLSKRTSL